MTIQEVKNNFVQNLVENAYINMCSVEEMEITIKALEKQIPKKFITKNIVCGDMNYKRFYCPNCKKLIITKVNDDFNEDFI